MTKIVAIAKIGKSVFSTNINDFIFHSTYNSFKIIKEATFVISLAASTNNQSFYISHGQIFIPLVAAFAKQTGIAQVFLPNADNIDTWGPKAGWTSTGIRFNYVAADIDHVIFNFNNTIASVKEVSIRFFLLEKVS